MPRTEEDRRSGLRRLLEILLRGNPVLSLRGAELLVLFALSVAGFLYFLVLPRRPWWGTGPSPIFGNLAQNLIPSESLRGLVFVLWIGCVALYGKMSRFR